MLSFYPEDRESAVQRLNYGLKAITEWTQKNGLKINGAKTEAIIFGRTAQDLSVALQDKMLLNSESIKFLVCEWIRR